MILEGIIAFQAVLFLVEDVWLHARQHRVYLSTKEVPKVLSSKMPQEVFAKARSYALDKSSYHLWYHTNDFPSFAVALIWKLIDNIIGNLCTNSFRSSDSSFCWDTLCSFGTCRLPYFVWDLESMQKFVRRRSKLLQFYF
jgi:hypothetical protein